MLRDAIADQLNSAVGGVVDTIMKGIWAASVWLLRTVFQLVDSFTVIDFVSVDGGVDPASPIATIWPLMRWLSLAIALGLFFLQLAMTMLRGGRGLFRLATGPLAYGVAVSLTAGGIGLLFAAGDGISAMLLDQGLKADGFIGVLDSTAAQQFFVPSPRLDADPVAVESTAAVASQLDATARAVVLGLVALFGVLPAGVGFLLENIFRMAVFMVLVATSPITAAGLLSDSTASWHWRLLRWSVAAAGLKPALALVLVIGVNMLSKPTGLAGLLAGSGVLLVALFAPFALYRLLAFVDPGTNAGAATRGFLSTQFSGGQSGGSGGGDGGSPGGADGGEAAHAARFDAAGGGSGAGAGAGGAAAGGGSAAGGGAAAGAGAAAGGVVAGVGAAVAAAGKFAGQYANATMDASGVGHPHGGRGGAPHGARGDSGGHGGGHGGGGSPGGSGDSGGRDDDSSSVAMPEYGDGNDEPPYEPGYDPGDDEPGDYDPGPEYGNPGSGYGDGGYGYADDDPAVRPAYAAGSPTGGGASAAPPPTGT